MLPACVSITTQTATLMQLPQAPMTDKYLSLRTRYAFACSCVSARVLNLQRKSSFASPSCNQSLLNEAASDTPQWQQRKFTVRILFLEDVAGVYTHAHDKEDVFIPIWAVFNTGKHADRHERAHTHTHRRRPGPPAAQGFQTAISCSVLTKRGTKAVMSQLLQTHLKHSPDWLTADGRDR